jgi:hypothetical protein
MIYDIIYLYNQFIDDLPDTYLEFITKVITLLTVIIQLIAVA